MAAELEIKVGAIPDIERFRDALLIAAAFCAMTALISFVLPGRAADGSQAQSPGEGEELEEIMQQEAELAGADLVLAEAQSPLALSSENLS